MKKIKLLFISFLLMLSITKTNAQEKKNIEVVTLKSVEFFGLIGKPVVYVIKPDYTVETLELKKIKNDTEELANNAVVLQKELKKWLDLGFKISAHSESQAGAISLTTIILVKE